MLIKSVNDHHRGIRKVFVFLESHKSLALVKDLAPLRSRLLPTKKLELAELEQRILNPGQQVSASDRYDSTS